MDNQDQVVHPEEPKVNVSKWRARFKASEKFMKDDFFYRYNLARQRIRSEMNVVNRNTKKMTHDNVNLVYSIGQSFVNSVYFKAPEVNLMARDMPETEVVENTEVKVNDILKDQKVKRTVERCLWDAYLSGIGCAYIDYLYDDQIVENLEPHPFIPGQMVPVQSRIVTKNEVSIQRIRPDLLRFPRGFDFDNFQDSPWIGFDMIMDLDAAKNNQAWNPAVREELTGSKYEKLSSLTDAKTGAIEASDDLYVKIHFVFEKPMARRTKTA